MKPPVNDRQLRCNSVAGEGIQKGGVIYVSQARKRIKARNQRDDDLDARKLTRADLATRRRLFKVFEQCVAVRREAIRQMKA
jgi:hypothetical protein